ncbi:hypothetical protein PsYK624_039620 [Phanerochaete sordida]|uniref:Transmembrane protein n=1 Tax=Phanerochaete sordida TaxID=48140 RepID=A0A9P3G421_9APHY|nr:hypothetical protein PsYK624_039620 [Phanerochaete sordida]
MSSAQLRSLLLILLSFIYNFVVSDALVNVTIDDSLTSLIQYTPANSWDDTIACSGCAASLDAARAHNSTWHRSIYEPGTGDGDLPLATVHFDGTGIFVYCVISEPSEMAFFIDGESVGSFGPLSSMTTAFDHSVLVYANDSIAAGPHTFVLQNGRLGGTQSVVLLDYFIYTREGDASMLASPTTNLPSSSRALSPRVFSFESTQLVQASLASDPSNTPTETLTSDVNTNSSFLASSSPSAPLEASSSLSTVPSSSISSSALSIIPSTVASAASGPPSLAAGSSSHPPAMSDRTRTIVLASAIPGGVILLLLLAGLFVYWRLQHRSRYQRPAPGINEDPASSGWTSDAWVLRHGEGSHGHSAHGHDTSYSSGLLGHSRNATDTVGRSRGLTISSAISSTGSALSDPASHSSAASSTHTTPPAFPFPSLSSEDELYNASRYAPQAEASTRIRHPYASRTPEPYDHMEERRPLSTVPEMPTPEQSSTSHENAPRGVLSPAALVAAAQAGHLLCAPGQPDAGRFLPAAFPPSAARAQLR